MNVDRQAETVVERLLSEDGGKYSFYYHPRTKEVTMHQPDPRDESSREWKVIKADSLKLAKLYVKKRTRSTRYKV